MCEEAIAQIVPTAPHPSALFGEFESEEEIAVGSGLNRTAVAGQDNDEAAHHSDFLHHDVAPPANLEAMLHQEIVGMTTNDATAQIFADCQSIPCESMISGASFDEDSMVDKDFVAEDAGMESDGDFRAQIIEFVREDGFGQQAAELESNNNDELTFAEDELEETDLSEMELSDIEISDREIEYAELSDEPADPNGPALRFVAEAADREPEDTFDRVTRNDDSDMLVIEDELNLRGVEKEPLLQEDAEPPMSVDFQAMMSRMRTGT